MNTPTPAPALEWFGFVQQVSSRYPRLPANVPAKTMRAIYHPNDSRPLEFLGDRMADRGNVAKLNVWLGLHAPRIQRHFSQHCGGPNSEEWCQYDSNGGHFHGTPNASYGYCYCVAWLDETPSAPVDSPTP